MIDIETADLYFYAIKKWGYIDQIRMLQEECAELIVALNHYCRGRAESEAEVIEEIADVQIMCEQILCAIPSGEYQMGIQRRSKLNKLKHLLELADLVQKEKDALKP